MKREKAASTTTPNKDNHFRGQKRRIYKAFREFPKTMLQVSFETGIFRANICSYVAVMKDKGAIEEVRKGLCPISKHKAGFYTTVKRINTTEKGINATENPINITINPINDNINPIDVHINSINEKGGGDV